MSAGPPPRPEPPRGISGVTWLVGVAAVLGLAYITLNTARTDAPGARGVPAGRPLPPFAAPLARSGLEGDANVAVTRQGAGGPRPACEVRGPGVLNVCALAEAGPVVLAFVAARPRACLNQLDVLDRAARARPRARFAAVAIRGDRGDLRATVRRRGWRIPVAHDRDGAVSNVYGIGVCPTIHFAARGGINRATTYGTLTEREVLARVDRVR